VKKVSHMHFVDRRFFMLDALWVLPSNYAGNKSCQQRHYQIVKSLSDVWQSISTNSTLNHHGITSARQCKLSTLHTGNDRLQTEDTCYLRGVCCWTMRRAVSRRNTSQSGCVMCWSTENGYCWTRQVSHISKARRRLRELSSAMRWASSVGKFRLSLRQTWCSTWTICN